MARPGSGRRRETVLLPLAVVVLLVGSATPARYLGWLSWVQEIVLVAAAPISHPMTSAASWLKPAVSGDTRPEELRFMEQQAEQWETLYRREQRENRLLRARIAELSRGASVNTLPVRQIPAPVIAGSSDLTSGVLTVRAGKNAGVEVNTVAAVKGTDLVGKVEGVGAVTCQVRPITDPGALPLRGRVEIDASASPEARSLVCLLRPAGEGLLRGDVQDPAELAGHDQASIDDWLEIGQTVRLDDDAWPANAQMLIVGTIAAIEPAADDPLRRIITVRPRVTLSRISEVVLRVLVPDEAGLGAAAPGGSGPDQDQIGGAP